MSYRLSPLAEAEVDGLAADGITPTAAEIVHINALAHLVESPTSRVALARGRPVAVGGVYLWPMTLAGSDWFRNVGGNLPGQTLQIYALAYAMAHGRKELPWDAREAQGVVRAWGHSLKCRMAELEAAIGGVVDQDEPPPDTGETARSATAGELSVMLAAMTSTDPAVWEYQCSLTYVLAMLDTLVAQNAAKGESTKHDPRIKAERALGLVVHRIRKRAQRG